VTDNRFLLEYLFFSLAALAWAGWELWSVRRPRGSEKPPRHPER
jgi:hypothetical protein